MKITDTVVSADPVVGCPACGSPAEIVDRFTLDGSPHPVEHIKLVCVARHWFTMPSDSLPGDDWAKTRTDIAVIQ